MARKPGFDADLGRLKNRESNLQRDQRLLVFPSWRIPLGVSI
jgi:hypothetical protein